MIEAYCCGEDVFFVFVFCALTSRDDTHERDTNSSRQENIKNLPLALRAREEISGTDPGEVKWVNFHPPFSEPLFNRADAETSKTSTMLWFYYIIAKIHPLPPQIVDPRLNLSSTCRQVKRQARPDSIEQNMPLDGAAFYNWVAFAIEWLEWGRTFFGVKDRSYLRLANMPECLYCSFNEKQSVFHSI